MTHPTSDPPRISDPGSDLPAGLRALVEDARRQVPADEELRALGAALTPIVGVELGPPPPGAPLQPMGGGGSSAGGAGASGGSGGGAMAAAASGGAVKLGGIVVVAAIAGAGAWLSLHSGAESVAASAAARGDLQTSGAGPAEAVAPANRRPRGDEVGADGDEGTMRGRAQPGGSETVASQAAQADRAPGERRAAGPVGGLRAGVGVIPSGGATPAVGAVDVRGPGATVLAPAMGAEAESRLLGEAQLALAKDPARALALARQHGERFPHGQLAQEREVIIVDALSRLGRTGAARERAERFGENYSGSLHEPKVDAVLEAPKASP